MPIRRLDPLLVDRIAAGEVVERPAAAVKELIENALDAGARRIDVAIEAGGRGLSASTDDGGGMDADDLALSVERHATSKIPDGDLATIATLGFRGEALPSIASVSRLEIRSRAARRRRGVRARRRGRARRARCAPCRHPAGTRVEARDLFAATPARLKFLKSDRAEAQACADVVRRLALASPGVRFSFASDLGASFDWPACAAGEAGERERLRQALGDAFVADALRVEAAREGVRISGWVGLPTFNKPNALSQYFFVNRRAVRDRLLSGALARRRARLHPARPPLRRGAVRRLRAERGRRQRPSGQGRSALPRQRAHARAADRRGAPGLRGGAASRQRPRGGVDTLAAMRAPRYRAAPPADAPGLTWDWRASPAAPWAGREPLRRAGAGRFRRLRPGGRRARRRGAGGRRPRRAARRGARAGA